PGPQRGARGRLGPRRVRARRRPGGGGLSVLRYALVTRLWQTLTSPAADDARRPGRGRQWSTRLRSRQPARSKLRHRVCSIAQFGPSTCRETQPESKPSCHARAASAQVNDGDLSHSPELHRSWRPPVVPPGDVVRPRYAPAPHPVQITASLRPQVRGKFLFVGDEKFYVKGVTYGAFQPDANG